MNEETTPVPDRDLQKQSTKHLNVSLKNRMRTESRRRRRQKTERTVRTEGSGRVPLGRLSPGERRAGGSVRARRSAAPLAEEKSSDLQRPSVLCPAPAALKGAAAAR